MTELELSKTDIVREIEEKTKDLEVFFNARESIRRRVMEVRDSQSPLTPLPYWSGTDAVLGTLDLVIHSIERTIDELKIMLRQLDGGVENELQ